MSFAAGGFAPGATTLEQDTPIRSPQRVSAALAAAQAALAAPVGFTGEDGGRSLAEMAQRDLDAALQLLADRAQYITGASGAAIALRRDGRNDMLCRASTGSNAPELGALLSTEFGLSGESVRTRQILRCDDAERDARVNREVCRQLGIASVVVMPVVNDDQVLGVFELFSGKANAFGERDLSAVQRLSEMVETAVRLARATETLPEQLKTAASGAAEVADSEVREGQFLSDLVVADPAQVRAVEAVEDEDVLECVAEAAPAEPPQSEVALPPVAAANVVVPQTPPAPAATSPVEPEQAPAATAAAPKKTLFWSAALDSDAEAATPAEADQSHVPPVLRGLRKCEACGFPVSAGRVLCVECEEKKWRGQLRTPPRSTVAKPVTSVRLSAPSSPSQPSRSAAQAFSAAAPSMAKTAAPAPSPIAPTAPTAASVPTPLPAQALAGEGGKVESQPSQSDVASISAARETAPQPAMLSAKAPSPELFLSAGLEPSQSWLSRNKYIVGVLLAIGGAVAAVFLLR